MNNPMSDFLGTLEGQMLQGEIEQLLHAVQSGVSFTRGHDERHGIAEDKRETGPKHLRVGINSAHCNHAALVRLLMRKGLIGPKEYLEAEREVLLEEKARYEASLSKSHGGAVIKLV